MRSSEDIRSLACGAGGVDAQSVRLYRAIRTLGLLLKLDEMGSEVREAREVADEVVGELMRTGCPREVDAAGL